MWCSVVWVRQDPSISRVVQQFIPLQSSVSLKTRHSSVAAAMWAYKIYTLSRQQSKYFSIKHLKISKSWPIVKTVPSSVIIWPIHMWSTCHWPDLDLWQIEITLWQQFKTGGSRILWRLFWNNLYRDVPHFLLDQDWEEMLPFHSSSFHQNPPHCHFRILYPQLLPSLVSPTKAPRNFGINIEEIIPSYHLSRCEPNRFTTQWSLDRVKVGSLDTAQTQPMAVFMKNRQHLLRFQPRLQQYRYDRWAANLEKLEFQMKISSSKWHQHKYFIFSIKYCSFEDLWSIIVQIVWIVLIAQTPHYNNQTTRCR